MKPYFEDETTALYLGDCRDVLAEVPEASVDAIVTDPPYELGFMGRAWDASGIAYDVGMWAECLRVLKPGGHLLAFGGTRTYHRMVCAIEDAGFEIRDSIHWIYGCLTADAEILTEHGWKPGTEVRKGERVAQWDHATGRITLAPVEQTYRAPWDGPVRVLRNDDTDQVLTPNHRVYHRPSRRRMVDGARRRWYDPTWEVAEAGSISTWNLVQLPLAGEHDGPGIGGDDYAALLGWVWTEGGFDLSGTGVRIYQSSVNADKVAEIASLLDRLGPHKRYDREREWRGRAYTESTWFMSGALAERVRADLPGKRPTYDLVWRMTGSEKRALLRAAMLGDGSGHGTRSEQFYQQYEDDLVWLQTLLALIGRAGKVGMRPNRPGGAVYLRNGATTELQARHLRDAWQQYTGEVWCVKVPTGAFVARRNGRVFITGNSGFPKGTDIGKAIDRRRDDREAVLQVTAWLAAARDRAGFTNQQVDAVFGFDGMARHWTAQGMTAAVPPWEHWERLRELLGFGDEMDDQVRKLNERKGVLGENWEARKVVGHRHSGLEQGGSSVFLSGTTQRHEDGMVPVTAPASVDAKRWHGWNTALKPAHEPIVVARKSTGFDTVTVTVLTHGTGALNIDGCRVDASARPLRLSDRSSGNNTYGDGLHGSFAAGETSTGRWPTNLILTHSASCVEDGACTEDCPVAELDRQSGVTRSGAAAVSARSAWKLDDFEAPRAFGVHIQCDLSRPVVLVGRVGAFVREGVDVDVAAAVDGDGEVALAAEAGAVEAVAQVPVSADAERGRRLDPVAALGEDGDGLGCGLRRGGHRSLAGGLAGDGSAAVARRGGGVGGLVVRLLAGADDRSDDAQEHEDAYQGSAADEYRAGFALGSLRRVVLGSVRALLGRVVHRGGPVVASYVRASGKASYSRPSSVSYLPTGRASLEGATGRQWPERNAGRWS